MAFPTVLPKNALTGKAYNGINVVMLWCEAQLREFPYAVWGTYKQWQEVGAQVRKGEALIARDLLQGVRGPT